MAELGVESVLCNASITKLSLLSQPETLWHSSKLILPSCCYRKAQRIPAFLA